MINSDAANVWLKSIDSVGSERGQSNLLESNHAVDDDEGYEPNPTEEQKDEEDEQREFNILLQSFREVEVQAEVEMLLKEKDIELSVIQRAYMEEVNLQESLREMEKWAVRRSRAMDAICDEIIASKYMWVALEAAIHVAGTDMWNGKSPFEPHIVYEKSRTRIALEVILSTKILCNWNAFIA